MVDIAYRLLKHINFQIFIGHCSLIFSFPGQQFLCSKKCVHLIFCRVIQLREIYIIWKSSSECAMGDWEYYNVLTYNMGYRFISNWLDQKTLYFVRASGLFMKVQGFLLSQFEEPITMFQGENIIMLPISHCKQWKELGMEWNYSASLYGLQSTEQRRSK